MQRDRKTSAIPDARNHGGIDFGRIVLVNLYNVLYMKFSQWRPTNPLLAM